MMAKTRPVRPIKITSGINRKPTQKNDSRMATAMPMNAAMVTVI
jgi:hypothetical protein